MAKTVLKDADVEVAGVNISDHVKSVTIETERDEVELTAMGATNKEFGPGLGDATITLEVYQDYAASEIDVTMFPLSTSDTPFAVRVKPTSSAASATNPVYQLTSLLYSYSPIAGSVGEANMTELVFRNASQEGLERFTDDSSS